MTVPVAQDPRETAEQFVSAALMEGKASEEFLTYFVTALSQRLDELRADPETLERRISIAGFLLAALLRNFYWGTADEFFWRPGALQNALFHLAEGLGVHMLPVHFYSPVPDAKQLSAALWTRRSELAGIDMNDAGQLALLSELSARFRRELDHLPEQRPGDAPPYAFYLANGNFGNIDTAFFYSIIRRFKPKRIYEIGSGFTTFLAAEAIRKNQQEDARYRCELVAIEPFPSEVLKSGFPGLSRLMELRAQDVPLAEFQKLESNDVLFIDSSHVLKIGSDVQYEFLEILPRLNDGVLVHAHDIFLPMEYPREWVMEMNRYWTEQYLLQAFLIHNDAYQVLLAANYLNMKYPNELKSGFGSSEKREVTGLGSFWMRKVR